MKLKLTRAQMKQLQPLFNKAARAHATGFDGVILMRPFGKDNPPKYSGVMYAAFIKHELAFWILDILQNNQSMVVKR